MVEDLDQMSSISRGRVDQARRGDSSHQVRKTSSRGREGRMTGRGESSHPERRTGNRERVDQTTRGD